MMSLTTVVLGGATHSASASPPASVVVTVTPARKFTIVSLWYQKTKPGRPPSGAVSRSSQVMVTGSPRLTCFSRDPRMEAEGLLTSRCEVRVFTPDAVEACSNPQLQGQQR